MWDVEKLYKGCIKMQVEQNKGWIIGRECEYAQGQG